MIRAEWKVRTGGKGKAANLREAEFPGLKGCLGKDKLGMVGILKGGDEDDLGARDLVELLDPGGELLLEEVREGAVNAAGLDVLVVGVDEGAGQDQGVRLLHLHFRHEIHKGLVVQVVGERVGPGGHDDGHGPAIHLGRVVVVVEDVGGAAGLHGRGGSPDDLGGGELAAADVGALQGHDLPGEDAVGGGLGEVHLGPESTRLPRRLELHRGFIQLAIRVAADSPDNVRLRL